MASAQQKPRERLQGSRAGCHVSRLRLTKLRATEPHARRLQRPGQAGKPGEQEARPPYHSYHRTLLHVWVAPSGEPATMGTWMGLCCLFVTRSSFSSNDLQVASRACSLASILSNRKQIVWLMEYRNDCKWKKETAQKGCCDCRVTAQFQMHLQQQKWPCILAPLFQQKHAQRPGQALPLSQGHCGTPSPGGSPAHSRTHNSSSGCHLCTASLPPSGQHAISSCHSEGSGTLHWPTFSPASSQQGPWQPTLSLESPLFPVTVTATPTPGPHLQAEPTSHAPTPAPRNASHWSSQLVTAWAMLNKWEFACPLLSHPQLWGGEGEECP